ncbi:MAG: hypothetical protein DRH57_02195 [Candidatus Cloacimonadota bacterium]|nr:MAG: hypothetical protein DRH57_02195 [Candidatus Cloacimonadota bacterium]
MSENKSEEMIDYILKNAYNEAESKVRIAQKIKKRELDNAREEADNIKNIDYKAIKERLLSEEKKEIRSKQLIIRRDKLKKEQEIINRIFSDTLTSLQKSPIDNKYFSLLENLSLQGIKLLDTNEVILAFNKRDKEFVESRKKVFADFIQKRIGKINFTIEKSKEPISGGVIISNKERSVFYYNNFEEIIRRNQDELELMLINKFFKV